MSSTLHNPYKILGVTPLASTEEIKTAYRKLAMKYHPDRNPNNQYAEKRFKEVTEAYSSLRNIKSKRPFNKQNSDFEDYSYTKANWQDVFEKVDISFNTNYSSNYVGNAIFNALLKGVNNVATDFMRKQGLVVGEDHSTVLCLNLNEARHGSTKRLRLPKSKKYLDVSTPANVYDGQKLRLRGQGGRGNPPGDLYVTLNVKLPREVSIKGKDINMALAITPLEAKYGLKSKLLDLNMSLPPGLQDGQRVRISGGGLAGGDLLITIKIRVWQGLWRKAKDWLKN